MAWELIFMLLLLKIPLFYLCGVVWYAVRAEPIVDDAPGDLMPVREPRRPGPPTGGRDRLARRRLVGPARRPARSRDAHARAGVRR
ncbi:MAG: hypothetical protein ABI927_04175 [Gaiellaceae bacterium]